MRGGNKTHTHTEKQNKTPAFNNCGVFELQLPRGGQLGGGGGAEPASRQQGLGAENQLRPGEPEKRMEGARTPKSPAELSSAIHAPRFRGVNKPPGTPLREVNNEPAAAVAGAGAGAQPGKGAALANSGDGMGWGGVGGRIPRDCGVAGAALNPDLSNAWREKGSRSERPRGRETEGARGRARTGPAGPARGRAGGCGRPPSPAQRSAARRRRHPPSVSSGIGCTPRQEGRGSRHPRSPQASERPQSSGRGGLGPGSSGTRP